MTFPGSRCIEGEILALIGPNGAGKSTLLRLLGLLERPTSGEILTPGEAGPSRFPRALGAASSFACVFQEALLCDATVEANAALGLRLRGRPAAEVESGVKLWLHRLGVAHLADRRARTLSGGEAQRVSLARAFAIRPEILLLDEPFAALDPPTRVELPDAPQELLRHAGCTTIFVTHDREEALQLGDRIAVIMDGRVRQLGRPSEVFGRPATEEVARFVGVETILDGRVVGERDGLLSVEVNGATIEALGKRKPATTSWCACDRKTLSFGDAGTHIPKAHGITWTAWSRTRRASKPNIASKSPAARRWSRW